jgi:hypothetical protein
LVKLSLEEKTISVDVYFKAALNLHHYIVNKHWNGQAIKGPTPIGKINWRITRFIKGYLRWLPWPDQYIFLQGQGYWIRSNLNLFELTGDVFYREIARQCSDYVVQLQQPEGYWIYPPLYERRNFINTVEGVWVSLGLIKAYQILDDPTYLEAVLKWYDYQINVIGFEKYKDGLCINYYAHSHHLVPNVTTMLLWLVAEIYQTTQDRRFLEYTGEMTRFLEYSQLDTGELAYVFPGRPHFQCYQYNSFQFLDLAFYYDIVQEARMRQLIDRLAAFLATGLTDQHNCRYDCFKNTPQVNYWLAALGTALLKAHQLSLGDYLALSERAYRNLLNYQHGNGGFGFSRKNYRFFADHRSYPQQLSMILTHLLFKVASPNISQAAFSSVARENI